MSGSSEPTVVVWRKALRSQEQGACVEVADLSGAVAVRDSKNPSGPVLFIPHDTWRTFADLVKAGRLDL